MKDKSCSFQLLRNKQKCEAITQMKAKLQNHVPADVSADDIGKAMIRLNVPVNTQNSTYGFDNQDIKRVYHIILNTAPY